MEVIFLITEWQFSTVPLLILHKHCAVCAWNVFQSTS